MEKTSAWTQCPIDLSDEDVMEAMKRIPGFLDITPSDFREIYGFAYQQAMERLGRSIQARHVMTRPVFFVHEETPVMAVAELLASRPISGVPVVNALIQVVGVISEKDFLHEWGGKENQRFMAVIVACMKNKGCLAVSLKEKLARDMMSTPPFMVREEIPVADIAALFEERKINRVPVVDKDGRLQGIVTRSDIVSSYCRRGKILEGVPAA